jgi:hypothetical protein
MHVGDTYQLCSTQPQFKLRMFSPELCAYMGIKIATGSSALNFVRGQCCLPTVMENQNVNRSGLVRVQSVLTLLLNPECLTFVVDLKRFTCGLTLELLFLCRIAAQCEFMGYALCRLHKP